jgi:hypothetical protein
MREVLAPSTWKCLQDVTNTANVSQYQEQLLASMALSELGLLDENEESFMIEELVKGFDLKMKFTLPFFFFFLTAIPFHLSLRDYNGRPQYVCSILAVVCQLLMFIPKENYSKVNLRLFPYIVALSSSHHHGIRLISHIVLLRTLRRIKDESLNAGGINEGSLNAILETMYDYLSKNKDCQKWIEKFQSSVPSKNPVLEGLELAEIMCKQRFENGQLLHDWVPLYVFERLSSFDEIECLLNSFMNGKNTRR